MRLLNTTTLELHDFAHYNVPPYAILSHTWSEDEVTFADMSKHIRTSMKGYSKLEQTCRLARVREIKFAWIDTCCIDKSSSAELTESINSMFQWYADAEVCFVFLEDLRPAYTMAEGLASCRWCKRGWTLQELLAPSQVEFYDMVWHPRGSKSQHLDVISKCTRIPVEVLREGRLTLPAYSVAARMSWAARRLTSRIEDMAYCLLGIFDINMPLIYGEGLKAFRRLQEEIVKRSNDFTIFAWDLPPGQSSVHMNLFARSPAAFIDSAEIVPSRGDNVEFSVTNKGLLVSEEVLIRIAQVEIPGGDELRSVYYIRLGFKNEYEDASVGIYLRKIGPKLFYRDGTYRLAGLGTNRIQEIAWYIETDYYILTDPMAWNVASTVTSFRQGAIFVSRDMTFELIKVTPRTLWECSDHVFLKPMRYSSDPENTMLAMMFRGFLNGVMVRVVVICNYALSGFAAGCSVFRPEDYPRECAVIFRYRREHMQVSDLAMQFPKIVALGNRAKVHVGEKATYIVVSFLPRWGSDRVLKLDVEEATSADDEASEIV